MTDSERQEFWACLCLKHAPGLGPRTAKRILEHYGSAAAAVEKAGTWRDRKLASSQQLRAFLAESWREEAETELAKAEDKHIPVLPWSDQRYPRCLREIPDPPVFLYALGDIALLDNPGVAMVGSRECSRYGVDLARRIALELSGQGVTVISGLAHGIDREAHLGGLDGPGSSIAVMGTGPDLVYPAANRDIWQAMAEKGLLLSEFPPGTKPLAGNFPLRNRIISGLSLGVLVVEASTRSGSLITARLAMEQGREVFALPGPVSLESYRGCHEIINKGARLVHGAQDILVELKPQLEAFLAGHSPPRKAGPTRPEQALLVPDRSAPAVPAKSARKNAPPAIPPLRQDDTASPAKPERDSKGRSPLAAGGLPPSSASGPARPVAPSRERAPTSAFEDTIAGHLTDMGATHIDSLCRLFGKEASEMSRTLVVLELKGVVRRLPGGYYLPA